MKCRQCGVEIKDGATFCLECGANQRTDNNIRQNQKAVQVQNRQSNNNLHTNGLDSAASEKDNKKKKSKAPIVILIVALALLLVLTLTATAIFVADKLEERQKDSERNVASQGDAASADEFEYSGIPAGKVEIEVTEKDEEKNDSAVEALPKENDSEDSVEVSVDTYSTWTSPWFNVSCTYPSELFAYLNETDGGMYETESAKWHTTKFCAMGDYSEKQVLCIDVYTAENPNGNGILESVLESLSKSSDVEITYSDSGDRWYAVSYWKGDVGYYKKCIIKDNIVAAFVINWDKTDHELYANEYVPYMEKNFKFTD